VLSRQVLAAVAQFDKSCLVAKLRAARNKVHQETVRCEGGLKVVLLGLLHISSGPRVLSISTDGGSIQLPKA